jgi:hypothetical protein
VDLFWNDPIPIRIKTKTYSETQTNIFLLKYAGINMQLQKSQKLQNILLSRVTWYTW